MSGDWVQCPVCGGRGKMPGRRTTCTMCGGRKRVSSGQSKARARRQARDKRERDPRLPKGS